MALQCNDVSESRGVTSKILKWKTISPEFQMIRNDFHRSKKKKQSCISGLTSLQHVTLAYL